MKAFETPELLVTIFVVEDIITTSQEPSDPIEPTKGDTGTDIL